MMWKILFVALALAFGWPSDARAVDYCQYGSETTLFLIDRTTAYDERDTEVLVGGIDPLFAELAPGERLVVQTIGGDPTASEKLYDACVPGCPEGGFMDWLASNCSAMVAKRDQLGEKRRLLEVFRDVLTNHESHTHSDISGTIAEVTRTYSAAAERGRSQPIGLVVVFSDMLENSRSVPWSSFRSMSVSAFLDAAKRGGAVPELQDTDVVAFGFGRSHDRDRAALAPSTSEAVKAKWRAYFKAGGAKSVRIGTRYE